MKIYVISKLNINTNVRIHRYVGNDVNQAVAAYNAIWENNDFESAADVEIWVDGKLDKDTEDQAFLDLI